MIELFSKKLFVPREDAVREILGKRVGCCREQAMEAVGVSSAVAIRAPVSCGLRTTSGRRRRNLTTRSQLFAKKEQRKVQGGQGGVVRSWQDAVVGQGSNLFLVSLAAGLAKVESAVALSYDDIVREAGEAVESAADSASSIPDLKLDVDTSGLTDFFAQNPLAIVGGLVVLALPIIASQGFGQQQAYGTVSAKVAFEKLGNAEASAQLLDIRGGDDIRSGGTPDLRSYRKRVTQIPYTVGDVETFVAKVKGKFKEPEEITLYILDRFDGQSPTVSKLLVQNGFKSAYAIKDGAEGANGWQSSELPWLKPRKGFTLDISSLKEVFDTDGSSLVPATLGVAAAAGVGLVVFSEAETALQLLGSAALIQIFVKKLLFAKDRKKTFEELQTFLDTKIAPKELVSELQGIGKVLLPDYKELKTAAVNGAATLEKSVEAEAPALVGALNVSEPREAASSTVDIAESPAPASETEAPAAPVSTASTEPTSAPTEVSAEVASEPEVEEDPAEKELATTTPSQTTDLPRTNRPLSPYTQFPGMKPPHPPSKP